MALQGCCLNLKQSDLERGHQVHQRMKKNA
jgi:hypothetical protein